jgi:hypothetical protein
MKNEVQYKANEQKLKAIAKKLDADSIRAKHKKIIDFMGVCPMS